MKVLDEHLSNVAIGEKLINTIRLCFSFCKYCYSILMCVNSVIDSYKPNELPDLSKTLFCCIVIPRNFMVSFNIS